MIRLVGTTYCSITKARCNTWSKHPLLPRDSARGQHHNHERARVPGANVLRVRVGLQPDLKHERFSRRQSQYCESIVCSLMDVQVKQQQQHQEGRPGNRASAVERSISLHRTTKTDESHKKVPRQEVASTLRGSKVRLIHTTPEEQCD